MYVYFVDFFLTSSTSSLIWHPERSESMVSSSSSPSLWLTQHEAPHICLKCQLMKVPPWWLDTTFQNVIWYELAILKSLRFLVFGFAGWSKIEAIDSLVRKAGYNGEITDSVRRRISLTRYQSTLFTMHYSEYLSYVKATRGVVHGINGTSKPATALSWFKKLLQKWIWSFTFGCTFLIYLDICDSKFVWALGRVRDSRLGCSTIVKTFI